MKKILFIIILLFVVIFSAKNVYAKNTELKLKAVDIKLLQQEKGYDSAQSMTITDKYIIIILSSDKLSSNKIFVYDKNTYKLKKTKVIEDLKSHANGVTYNKDDNTIVIADDVNKRFVVYNVKDVNDSNFLKKIKEVKTQESYNNIAYDSDGKKYWVVITDPKYHKIISFDKNLNRIKDGNIELKNLESFGVKDVNYGDIKFRINQDIVYKDNYLYLINYVNKNNLKQSQSAFSNAKEYDTMIFSYYVGDGKQKGTKGNLIYSHSANVMKNNGNYNNIVMGDINEIEDIAFDGEKPYFLYQRGGRFRLYTSASTRNLNTKIQVKVETNNNNLLKDIGLNANFVSTSKNLNLNKKIKYDAKNGYLLSNINIKQTGEYTFKITQDNKSFSNWTIDKKTINATLNVRYDLNIDNLVCDQPSFDSNTFKNIFTFSKITVPLEVSAPVYNINNTSYKLNLKATLYNKDNKKITQVSIKNGKYLFNNLTFDKPGNYDYIIKQDNSGIKKDGIYTSNIDSSAIKVRIIVSQNGSKLTYKIKFDSKNKFNNKVTVKYNTVSNNYDISIITNKSNNKIATPQTKLNIYKGNKLLKTVNSNNNKYKFNIDINSPGVYKYKLIQDTSLTSKGIYNYNLDKKEIYLEITAKVEGNKLVCSGKLTNEKFNNKVTAEYSQIDVPIEIGIDSNIEGNISVPKTKAIIKGIGVSNEIESTNGYYKYNVKLKKEGVYKYIITQKNINNNKYQTNIDSSSITATVTVSSDVDKLNYKVEYSKSKFTNSFSEYNPVNLKLRTHINTTKNDDTVNDKQTTAYLYDSNNTLLKTTTSNNGKYIFDEISISEVGTFRYKIVQKQENSNLGNNITYSIDDKAIIVTIIVTNENGTLKAEVNYSDNEFNNVMDIKYSDIVVKPTFNIENVVSNGITKENDLNASLYSVDDNKEISSTSDQNDKYIFEIPISHPGDYEYIVKQKKSGLTNIENKIVYIDSDTKKINIHVVSENGILKASINYYLNDNTFSNYFKKKDEALNIPIKVKINNTLLNDKAKIPSTHAVLSELNDEGEYEILDKVENINGEYIFNNVEIVCEGTYTYRIIQENSGNLTNGIYNYNISSEEKIVVVNVTKDEKGNLVYKIEGIDNPFENSYDIKYEPITVQLSANISDSDNSFELINNKLLITDDIEVLDSIEINSASITSNKITIDKEGEYKYNIYQSKPYVYSYNGLSYNIDSKVIKADVIVKADENNKLNYTVTYDNDNNIKLFSNVHTPSTTDELNIINVPIDIDIFSNSNKLEGLKVKATIFEDGLPLETVVNNNGRYNFENINLSSPGIYTYTIKQVPINDDNWIIDDEVIGIDIEVYKDDSNNLNYSVHYNNDISSFTNIDLTDSSIYEDGMVTSLSDGSVIIDNVPSTSLFKNKFIIIIGFIMIGLGFYIVKYYKKKN